MNPVDAHFAYSRFCLHIQVAAATERKIVLGDLIGLGEIRIKVILPIKLAEVSDLAVQGQSCAYPVLQKRFIQHR
jgi:hypothetical protein